MCYVNARVIYYLEFIVLDSFIVEFICTKKQLITNNKDSGLQISC